MIAQLSTVLLLIVALAGSFQQAAPWTPPHKIETPTQSNWFPSVAVDPYGDVHLIWSSGKGLGEEAFDLLMYTRLRAGEWSTSNDIVQTGTGGWAARNSLAIDRNGRLHLLVRNRGAIYYASASAADAGSAQAWQSLRRMNGMGQPYYSTIAIDAGGVLHVVWEELSPKLGEDGCEGCSDIWYRQSTDGGATWSAPTNLSNGRSGAIKPKIVFKAPDQVYVSWDEGKDPNSPVGEPVGIAFAV